MAFVIYFHSSKIFFACDNDDFGANQILKLCSADYGMSWDRLSKYAGFVVCFHEYEIIKNVCLVFSTN